MCKICDEEKNDELNKKIQHMIHRLIPVLNSQENEVGLFAMIDLVASDWPWDKEVLLDTFSSVYDIYKNNNDEDDDHGDL